jgi:tetratricopeptide (TPR) repeat protein
MNTPHIKRFSSLFILIILSFLSIAQTSEQFSSEFKGFSAIADTANMRITLANWEAKFPEDAELFTGYFNYYFRLAKKEIVVLSTNQPKGESIVIKDSTNKTAGFMGSEIYYDSVLVRKGLEKIDQGIALYPNRLDMRFGKIYVLGLLEDWNTFTDEIKKTVAYSITNNNEWTWTNNEKKENAEEFFLASLQDYQTQLYNTGDDELLYNMREIAEEVLKYYPNHIESLTNIGLTYLIFEDYTKGLEMMLKAEKVDPKDYIVLSNIAYAYAQLGDKPNAIVYYDKTLKYGDAQAKRYAENQLLLLRAKD